MTRIRSTPNKIRISLSVKASSIEVAKTLAKLENRSISNLLEVLIERAGAPMVISQNLESKKETA